MVSSDELTSSTQTTSGGKGNLRNILIAKGAGVSEN
jgi:hypothetical protein